MKKRKPYSKGRVLHLPPLKEQKTKRPGWLFSSPYRFVSMEGSVQWHSRRAAWYGSLRDIHRCSYWAKHPYHGFTKAREAMIWVEQQHASREKRRTWKSTET